MLNRDNWAFSNLEDGTVYEASARVTELLYQRASRNRLIITSREAIVPVNGWKPGGGRDAGFSDDMGNLTDFAQRSGIRQYLPQGDQLVDIENAIKAAVDAGADDIFIYLTGHGFESGNRPHKDTVLRPQDLIEMMRKFPTARFKVVVQGCYGGKWVDPLKESGMVDIVLTAANGEQASYGDLDLGGDPNPDDTGSEYSSGLFEDLDAIAESGALQIEARGLAQEAGRDEFVGWLMLADVSAREKDVSLIRGLTEPQNWTRSGAAPAPSTTTTTLAPARTPIYDSIVAEASNTGGFLLDAPTLHRIFDEIGEALDSIRQREKEAVYIESIDIDMYGYNKVKFSDLGVAIDFNESAFECGEASLTRRVVCADRVLDMPPGDVLIAAMTLVGDVPVASAERSYIYSLVLDSDGFAENNWEFNEPFDWDLFQGTDRWYQLLWDHRQAKSSLTVNQLTDNGNVSGTEASTVRAVVDGNTIVFFVSMSEFASDTPGARLTAFHHDGRFSEETRGADVSGSDPTAPLDSISTRVDLGW